MAFSIPDKGEGLSSIQSIFFQEYLDIIVAGVDGATCVNSGCAVTAQAVPDMTVAVASGVVRSNGTVFTVTGANATISAADATNHRLDLIVITSAGDIATRTGTASATPFPAARTAHDVALAVVYVPANNTAVEAIQIVDLRIISVNRYGSSSQNFAVADLLVGSSISATGTFSLYNSGVQSVLELAGDGQYNYSMMLLWNNDYSKYWSFAHRGPLGGQNNFKFEYFDGTTYTSPLTIGADGVITATSFNGPLTGNASTATTANATVATLTRGTYLTGSNFNGSTATTWAVDATSTNTASKVVVRDASGNFAAGTITAALTGNASTASSAAAWTTGRTLTIGNTGKSVNGSADVSWSLAEIGSQTAGSATAGFVTYNGTTNTDGQFYGGATAPTGTTRLNYSGYFYPTLINLSSSADTATAATHYMVETGSDGYVRPKTLANVKVEILSTTNTAITGIKTATFNSEVALTTTTGAVDVDWSTAQNYKQNEPTGAITYTFTAPPGVCHLQLRIISDGTSAAQTITWPANVIWYGAVWAAVANKGAVINFWWDGTSYHAMGGNRV